MMSFLIGIDPGHGMGNRRRGVYDPGAVAFGVEEAKVVLEFAQALAYVAKLRGIPVWYTRRSAFEEAPLSRRVGRAVNAGCRVLVSLHCNAGPPGATGAETFHPSTGSEEFAERCQVASLASLGLRDRGVKPESKSQHQHLAILRFPGPCCLIELGFLTNPTDRAILTSRAARVRFADAFLTSLTQPEHL